MRKYRQLIVNGLGWMDWIDEIRLLDIYVGNTYNKKG